MKELIEKYPAKSVAFGVVMAVIGFFRGETVLTFPPVWPDLLKLFLIYAISFLAVNVLGDWIYTKLKRE